MIGQNERGDGDRCAEILTRVHLPLENLEFTIDSFLQDNGSVLDRQTRTMLIGMRENVHRVARSARQLATSPQDAAEADPPDDAPARVEMLPTAS